MNIGAETLIRSIDKMASGIDTCAEGAGSTASQETI
jgi:hypothetical protein